MNRAKRYRDQGSQLCSRMPSTAHLAWQLQVARRYLGAGQAVPRYLAGDLEQPRYYMKCTIWHLSLMCLTLYYYVSGPTTTSCDTQPNDAVNGQLEDEFSFPSAGSYDEGDLISSMRRSMVRSLEFYFRLA
jgi:hypothetical protein